MIKRLEVFDMDGCIVDSTHRFRIDPNTGRIDLPYWKANAHKAYQDKLLPLAEYYKYRLLDPETFVVIATCRVISQPDRDFITYKLGWPNHFIYRATDDTSKGADLKIRGLETLFKYRPDVAAAPIKKFYEDNKDYLLPVADRFNMIPVYTPSPQGV